MMNIQRRLTFWNSSGGKSRRRSADDRWNQSIESLEKRELLAADLEVLKNIAPGSASSLRAAGFSNSNTTAAEFNGWVYFSADDGVKGRELWRTDGTSLNTVLFADLNPGVGNADPSRFFEANGKLYFQARGLNDYGLFVTDGTLAGTKQLSGEVGDPIGVIGDTVYFYRGGRMTNNGAFWKSDGTAEGTVQFATGFPETGLREPIIFEDTLLYLYAGESELWKIDTITGVKTRVAVEPTKISGLTIFNGDLYFAGNDTSSTDPTNLWKLASVTATPEPVQNPGSGQMANNPDGLTVAGGTLFFAGILDGEGYELWRTDGTSSGTVRIKDINPGASHSIASPFELTPIGDSVYFAADDGVHGRELWKSSGLESNTFLLKDTVPGSDEGDPVNLFDFNGQLTFAAWIPPSLSTRALWTSDGTAAGTAPVSGEPFTVPSSFVALGNNLIFAAENATVGREPFIYRSGDRPAAPVITGPDAVNTSLRPTVTWNAVAGATDYEVWIKNQSTGEDQVLLEQVSATSFTPSIDLGIGNFTVWVRTLGLNGGPASVWTAPRNFRIKAPVTQVVVNPNPENGLSAISWQALPGAVKYDVWIDRLDVPTSQFYRNTDVTGTSISPASLPRGSYRVWVRGLAADGADGAWSTGVQFSSHPVPAITSGLNPTFDTTPTIAWTSVAGATSYEVYILRINGNVKALHQTNIVGTSFTWPALTPGPYRYWVRVSGDTVWSSPVEIDTSGRTNVLAPSGSTTDRTPTISWRPVDGAVRYELWVDLLGADEQIIYQTNLTTTSYTPTSNLPLGNYRVWVRAVSSSTAAPWSAYVDFSVANAESSVTPATDSDLLASIFSDSQMLPVLGGNPALVVDVRIASSIPVAPPKEPENVKMSLTSPVVHARSLSQV